jgi:hypothetical protein
VPSSGGSGSSSKDGGLQGMAGVPERENAPDFRRNSESAEMPSLVPKIVGSAKRGEAFLRRCLEGL